MTEKSTSFRAMLIGGILPLVVYTVVEEVYGILWGLIAGMTLGVLEIGLEKWRQGKVEMLTWVGNGLLLGLGGISLATQEGVWFRLQPAILEVAMGLGLLISARVGKPFLLLMARKQGTLKKMPPAIVPFMEKFLAGFTFRLSIFFLAHSILAIWAALAWSVRAWMLLKGVGFTVSLIGYCVAEALVMRKRLRKQLLKNS